MKTILTAIVVLALALGYANTGLAGDADNKWEFGDPPAKKKTAGKAEDKGSKIKRRARVRKAEAERRADRLSVRVLDVWKKHKELEKQASEALWEINDFKEKARNARNAARKATEKARNAPPDKKEALEKAAKKAREKAEQARKATEEARQRFNKAAGDRDNALREYKAAKEGVSQAYERANQNLAFFEDEVRKELAEAEAAEGDPNQKAEELLKATKGIKTLDKIPSRIPGPEEPAEEPKKPAAEPKGEDIAKAAQKPAMVVGDAASKDNVALQDIPPKEPKPELAATPEPKEPKVATPKPKATVPEPKGTTPKKPAVTAPEPKKDPELEKTKKELAATEARAKESEARARKLENRIKDLENLVAKLKGDVKRLASAPSDGSASQAPDRSVQLNGELRKMEEKIKAMQAELAKLKAEKERKKLEKMKKQLQKKAAYMEIIPFVKKANTRAADYRIAVSLAENKKQLQEHFNAAKDFAAKNVDKVLKALKARTQDFDNSVASELDVLLELNDMEQVVNDFKAKWSGVSCPADKSKAFDTARKMLADHEDVLRLYARIRLRIADILRPPAK